MSIAHKNGNLGENIAEKFLINKGYTILEKNFRIRGGEIDIIAQKDEIFVFVEVKFRKSSDFAHPAELFDTKKAIPFLRSVYDYINQYNIDEENTRIDLIAILPQDH